MTIRGRRHVPDAITMQPTAPVSHPASSDSISRNWHQFLFGDTAPPIRPSELPPFP
jgi:hypothetical protein